MGLNTTSPYLTNQGGWTSAKSNFFANVIKGIAETTKSTLDNHVLIEKKLDRDGTPADYVQLTPELSPEQIIELATTEGRYYAVSAWLREGIKAKETVLTRVRTASPADLGIEMPDLTTFTAELVNPSLIVIPNENDVELVKDRLNVAELAEYLSLEAEAAHIGKRIHSQQGLFNQWRKQAVAFKPIEFLTPAPTQVFVLNNKLRLSVEQIDAVMLRLQGLHRDLEARLNAYKARLKTMVQELIQQRQAERAAAEVAWGAAYQQYSTTHKAALATAEAERSKQVLEVTKLGIVIPNAHAAILKEIEEKLAYKEDAATTTEVE